MIVPISTLAAAADAAKDFCGFDCSMNPWWEDMLAFVMLGSVPLPIALLLVWLLYRSKLDRWVLLNAFLVAIAAILLCDLPVLFGLNLYAPAYHLADLMGLQLSYMVFPQTLVVCFLGSAFFGWWLRRRRQKRKSAIT